MEFRNLYSFLKVAEIGNFTRAAELMGYAQSTVTAQIQQLESEIGLPLFEQVGKTKVLTQVGQQIVLYVNQILQIEERIINLGKTSLEEISGTLRIGIVESIMSSLLLEIIGEYRKRLPQVSIEIHTAVTEKLYESLRHNEVDLIFTMSPMINIPDFVRITSHPETAVFVSGKDHPLTKESDIPLPDIFDYPMLLTGTMTFINRALEKLAVKSGKKIISFIQTESSHVVIDLMDRGLGISFLPEYLARSTVAKQRIQTLAVSGYSLPFYVHVFYHKSKWVTPQMKELIQLVDEYWKKCDTLM